MWPWLDPFPCWFLGSWSKMGDSASKATLGAKGQRGPAVESRDAFINSGSWDDKSGRGEGAGESTACSLKVAG